MNELFNVKDKVVVITGGAGILGKGIAAYLAKEGAKVVVLDRSEEAGKALVESIKAEGNEAMFLYTDVMDKEVLEGNKVEIMKAYEERFYRKLLFRIGSSSVDTCGWLRSCKSCYC